MLNKYHTHTHTHTHKHTHKRYSQRSGCKFLLCAVGKTLRGEGKAMRSPMLGQSALQESSRSAQFWLTSISKTMTSALSDEGGLELRSVEKPRTLFLISFLFTLHCFLFPISLADRQEDKRHIDTYSLVPFRLSLWIWTNQVWVGLWAEQIWSSDLNKSEPLEKAKNKN